MLIILEGVDGSGKSTLAEKLWSELSHDYTGGVVKLLHKGPPERHPLDEYETPLLDYRPGTGEHIICDRWHVGELIYPRVLGRKSKLTSAMLWHIELFLQSRGALLVHVDVQLQELARRLKIRGDDLVKSVHLRELQNAYTDYVSGMSVLPLLRTQEHLINDGTVTLVGSIIERAAALEERYSRLNEFVTYVGVTQPDLLLLGDDRGKDVGTNRPAFVPYGNTSGSYLLSALGSYHPDLRVGLANACDVDDPMRLWRTLRKPGVVTLGRNATANVPVPTSWFDVRAVDHPQYVRRFHHHHAGEYGEHIVLGKVPSWRS